jgi:uncharacterized protein (TIGR00251 family)
MSDPAAAIKSHPQGATLSVRVQPGARKTAVLGMQAGAVKLAVTAPADQGKANAALIEFLHRLLAVKRSEIHLLSGTASRNKVFLFLNISANEIARRIREHVAIASNPANSKKTSEKDADHHPGEPR